MSESEHVLTIVIPALDEEAAIGATIQRCLDARAEIVRAGVSDVEIIAVSDGSTDRTEAIARSFDEVCVLAFERNRGYGAAIMCGFAHGRGDLLGFLDADGTCDPAFFADMCRALDGQNADLVLGSRMGEGSRMPWVRALGNTLFAWILGILSRRRVSDTASGMRVIRRAVLPQLYPLPEGLHFTPAMSARVLLEDRLRLVELPMPYAERAGRSKLSVLQDGARFLSCIVQAAVAYRPARPLLLIAAVLGLAAAVVGSGPVLFYGANQRLEEWMVYRLLLASLLASAAAVVVNAGVVAGRIAELAHGREASGGLTGLVTRCFNRRTRRIGTTLLLVASVVLVWPGAVEYVATGHVEMHWSRAVLASLLGMLALVLVSTTFLLHMMDLIQERRRVSPRIREPDRIRPAQPPDALG